MNICLVLDYIYHSREYTRPVPESFPFIQAAPWTTGKAPKNVHWMIQGAMGSSVSSSQNLKTHYYDFQGP